jgi:hypothetical protein
MDHGKNIYSTNGFIINFYENKIDKNVAKSEIDPNIPEVLNSFLDKLLMNQE